MITIEKKVFDDLVRILESGLPGTALGVVSDGVGIQIVDGGRKVRIFSPEEFCAALLRCQQVDMPSKEVSEKMTKNAGIKRPDITTEGGVKNSTGGL